MAKQIENMSDEELLEAWTAHGQKLEEAKEKNKAYSREFHQRESVKALAQKMGLDSENLTENQKTAIVALAEGIESSESVQEGSK